MRRPLPLSPSPADRPAGRRAALVVLCAAALIINLDNTILNVALPTLVRDLHATTSQLQWIVDSYAMVLAGLLLTGGSLADRFGRRLFFVTGLAVFAAGSAGAALAGSPGWLITGRAVMGAGAALTIPSSLSIISDLFRSPAARARAIGSWAATIGLGIALGPIVGGLLLGRFWWGSIFLVNIPIAVAAAIGALLLVPGSRNPAARRPDPGGAALSVTGLGLLLWAIIQAPVNGWTSGIVVVTGLASLAALAAFAAWEVRSSHPLLNPGFFADRRFSVAAAAETLATFGLLGGLFLQTQFLQSDLGYSPLQAGVRILPLAGVLIVTAAASPAVSRVTGTKLTATAGLAAIAAGLAYSAAVSTMAATYGTMLPGLLLIGLGAGLLLPAATNSVVGSVPAGDSGVGSAANSVALQVGGALGVAVIGSVMSTRYQDHIAGALAGHYLPAAAMHAILGSLGGALTVAGVGGGTAGALLARAARAAFMDGNQAALATGAGVAFAGACLVLALLPSQRTPRRPASRRSPVGASPSGKRSRRARAGSGLPRVRLPLSRLASMRLMGWSAAVLAMLTTLTLVVGELTDAGQRRWWAARPLTTDTVAGLLVLLVTVLIVNQLLNGRQARQRGHAVASQTAIMAAQAARSATAVSSVTDGPGDRSAASDGFRTYMMMLLIGAPVLIDDPVARHFLDQAQYLGGVMARTLAAIDASPREAAMPGDRLDDALHELQSAAAPLLRLLSPETRDFIQRIGRAAEDQGQGCRQ